jgi:hypothetical protein
VNEGVLLVILVGFLIVVLGLVDPYVPIQDVPKDELRVVSAMEVTPVTFHMIIPAALPPWPHCSTIISVSSLQKNRLLPHLLSMATNSR